VNEWLSQDEYNNHGRLKNIPYPETSEYVKKVKKTALTYERLYYSESETIKESVIQE
jgi:soluble lytic murein transglycosylase-like protein